MKRLIQLGGIAGLVWLVRSIQQGRLRLGIRTYDEQTLQAAIAAGRPISETVLGIARFPPTVTEDQAAGGIRSLRVLGLLQAEAPVRRGLANRTVIILGSHEEPQKDASR